MNKHFLNHKRILITILTLLFVFGQCNFAFAETDFSGDAMAINMVAKSVLMLEIYDKKDNCIATGSGFVAFNNQLMITNYHVIKNSSYIIANSDDGKQYRIDKVLCANQKMDVAILQFSTSTDLIPLNLNYNSTILRGEPIVAIGSPIGITNTVSKGNISALYEDNGVPYIQFTAPVSHGSSGGALFDNHGNVIGITSATYENAQNLNLAIRISVAQAMYNCWNKQVYDLSRTPQNSKIDLSTLTDVKVDNVISSEPVQLSFRAASGYEYLKTLNNRKVTINGYMATSSPVDGSFIFLMNLPYQSCPFCKPNTSELSNTMEVYPKKGEKFGFTNQAIRVTGTLEVAANKDESFTDLYGYEFNFRIVDAEFTVIRPEELSPEMAVWQKIAENDVISEIYRMYDYLNFLCGWPDYCVNPYTDEEGNLQPGYYLYPQDAEWYLNTDGAQFNYGRQEGYFSGIREQILKCDANAFTELIRNVDRAEQLANRALGELENEQYTWEYQYVERFGIEDYVFTLNRSDELLAEFDECYYGFADWLGTWEM